MIKRTLIKVLFLSLVFVVSLTLELTAVNDAATVAVTAEKPRELPVYSVGRDDNYISISFDCAWGTECADQFIC